MAGLSSQARWEIPRRDGLVCLLEVVKFHAGLYCSLSRLAGAFDLGIRSCSDDEGSLKTIADSLVKDILPKIRQDSVSAGLALVVMKIDQIADMHGRNAKSVKLLSEMVELNSRIVDSLSGVHFVRIPESQIALFENPHHGWEVVIENVPETATAIEEASKSLALGRDTASVFHLMGVMQVCLNKLARSLKVHIDVNTATWNQILELMQKAVNAKQGSTKKKFLWKLRLEPFYAEVMSDLKAVKNAWRNPTMHFWRTYSEEEARKIYDRVRDFSVMVARGPVSFRAK